MWLQYILISILLIFLLLGLYKSKYIIRVAGMSAYGFFLGVFYFLFFPMIIMGKLETIDKDIPSFPISAFPFVVFLFYLLETYVVFVVRKQKKAKQHHVNLAREVTIYWIAILMYFFIQVYLLFSSGILQGGHWYHTRGGFLTEYGSFATLLFFMVWATRLLIVAYTFELLYLKKITLVTALLVSLSIMFYSEHYRSGVSSFFRIALFCLFGCLCIIELPIC